MINNNVLKVFKNIIDKFLSGQRKTMQGIRIAGLAENSRVYKAYSKPMSAEDADFIGSTVVHPDEPYVDANAVTYGKAVGELNTNCIMYMNAIMTAKDNSDSLPKAGLKMQKTMNKVVTDMNSKNLYVDQAALTIWLKSLSARDRRALELKYNEVKKRVAGMFR